MAPYGTHDYDNDARPQSSAYDKGADEFTVAAPKAVFSINSLSFGNVVINSGKTLTVTLSNTGNLALALSSITVTGVGFSATPASTCGSSVAAGANCTISVTFSPTASGTLSGNLAVVDNDPTTPTTNIGLTGAGVTAFTLAPAPVNFGKVTRGNFANQTITLTNNTAVSLTNLAATLGTPGTSSDFSIRATGSCGTTLTAGSSCTIVVRFSPVTGNPIGSTQSRTLIVNGRQNASAITALTDALTGVAN